MKKVLCGSEKGYLIPKKELDEKLRKKFPILKNKIISAIESSCDEIKIEFYDEKNLTAWNYFAMHFAKKGDLKCALSTFDAAIGIYPSSDLTWNNKGLSLDKLGKDSAAEFANAEKHA